MHDAFRRVRPLVLALAGFACARGPQVWFVPNIGSADMAALFTRPDDWPKARRRVDVFGFYSGQLAPEAPCPHCGPNRLERLQQVRAFVRLRDWRIAIAIETSAIKPDDCDAAKNASFAIAAGRNVLAAGATPRYFAMDEPLLSGDRCGFDDAGSAFRTVQFMRAVEEGVPGSAVGDIEPYPALTADRIVDWTKALAAAGKRPAFLQVDVDRVHAARIGADVEGDLRRMVASFAADGLPFGVILWGADKTDDAGYSDDVLTWAQRLAGAGIRPTDVIFQSWSAQPDGSQTVPVNLPEDDAAVRSHTRLLDEGLLVLGGRW